MDENEVSLATGREKESALIASRESEVFLRMLAPGQSVVTIAAFLQPSF